MALPPFEAGAVQFTVAEPFPAVADTPVGGPGTPDGVTAFEGADTAPGPLALPATTVNVYDVPFAKPPTVALVAPAAADTVAPPGDAVTVYPVIALPPSEAGAVQCTVADAFPAVADGGIILTQEIQQELASVQSAPAFQLSF